MRNFLTSLIAYIIVLAFLSYVVSGMVSYIFGIDFGYMKGVSLLLLTALLHDFAKYNPGRE